MSNDDLSTMKRWALDNYEKGGDVIVECYDDDELRMVLLEAGSLEGALKELQNIAELWIEQKMNTRFGDEF